MWRLMLLQSCQRNWYRCLLIMIAAGVFAACSSINPSEYYSFSPLKTADQSKRFTYGFATRPFAGGTAGSRGSDAVLAERSPRSGAKPVNFEEMKEELEIYMSATGYCNTGYFVYDETFDGTQYLLHGECQESNNNE